VLIVGLQSREGRLMIDSIVWAQYTNMTDTQTATQPRRQSNSRPNALRRAAETKDRCLENKTRRLWAVTLNWLK